MAEEFGIVDFGNLAKNKKPKKTKKTGKEIEAPQEKQPEKEPEQQEEENLFAKIDIDKEYGFLLNRIKDQLEENNEDLINKDKSIKISMKPPEVERVAKSKSLWSNFGDCCDRMKRDHAHVQSFFQTETGCECILNPGGGMLIKGNYKEDSVVQYIKKYMQEYVGCQLCKSPNTILNKDKNNRLYIMECKNCKATRTVQTLQQKKH